MLCILISWYLRKLLSNFMEDNYSEILRKIDTEDNSIDNYKILRNKSNNQMKTLISQSILFFKKI